MSEDGRIKYSFLHLSSHSHRCHHRHRPPHPLMPKTHHNLQKGVSLGSEAMAFSVEQAQECEKQFLTWDSALTLCVHPLCAPRASETCSDILYSLMKVLNGQECYTHQPSCLSSQEIALTRPRFMYILHKLSIMLLKVIYS